MIFVHTPPFNIRNSDIFPLFKERTSPTKSEMAGEKQVISIVSMNEIFETSEIWRYP